MDAERRKRIFATVVVQTADAFSIALGVLPAKWRRPITTTIIGGIADNTGIGNTLAGIIGTIRITDARHTFRAIIAIDTERRIVSTAIVVVCVTDLAGTGHTGRGIIAAIVVT